MIGFEFLAGGLSWVSRIKRAKLCSMAFRKLFNCWLLVNDYGRWRILFSELQRARELTLNGAELFNRQACKHTLQPLALN